MRSFLSPVDKLSFTDVIPALAFEKWGSALSLLDIPASLRVHLYSCCFETDLKKKKRVCGKSNFKAPHIGSSGTHFSNGDYILTSHSLVFPRKLCAASACHEVPQLQTSLWPHPCTHVQNRSDHLPWRVLPLCYQVSQLLVNSRTMCKPSILLLKHAPC